MKVLYIILFSLYGLLLLFIWFLLVLYFIFDLISVIRLRKTLKEHDNE